MTLIPCKCGSAPAAKESAQSGINIIRVECACKRHGATLMYTKPADRERTLQAAADGWNLADSQ